MSTTDAFLPEPNPGDDRYDRDEVDSELDAEERRAEAGADDEFADDDLDADDEPDGDLDTGTGLGADASFRTPTPGRRLTASELEEELDDEM